MKRDGILVVGSANMDLVVTTPSFPDPGETVFGGGFGMYPGGKGANQAVCAAKLGGRTWFIGKMGKDVFADTLTRGMKHDGVRMEHLLTHAKQPTGTALITVDAKGQNEIVVVSGSNMQLTPADIARKRELFARAKIVLLQLEIPLETVVRAAALGRRHGALVILNPAPARRLPGPLLAMVDYLTPNETELMRLTGARVSSARTAGLAARQLLRSGVRNVIVTLGAQGCVLVNAGGSKRFPARTVRVVDTTAAGDAFNGALAFSLARGKTPEEAIPFANTVAGFAVGKMGAQGSMPTMRELEASLLEGP